MRGFITVGAFLAVALLLAAPVATPVSGENPSVAKSQESGLRFDSTVTLGNVLTAVAFLIGLLGAYAAFKARLATLELKVNTLWEAWVENHKKGGEKT